MTTKKQFDLNHIALYYEIICIACSKMSYIESVV